MRSSLLAVLLGLGSACASPALRTVPPPPENPDEVVACDRMLDQMRELDTASLDEATVDGWMRRADSERARCQRAFERAARNPVDLVFARHRAAQFELFALALERSLAERFDAGANRCEIVRDTFAALLRQLADVEAALQQEALAPDDVAKLQQLRSLDVQSLDVLFAQAEAGCREIIRASP